MEIDVVIKKGGRGKNDYTPYVRIPKPIYESIGKPKSFELKMEGRENTVAIILLPKRTS